MLYCLFFTIYILLEIQSIKLKQFTFIIYSVLFFYNNFWISSCEHEICMSIYVKFYTFISLSIMSYHFSIFCKKNIIFLINIFLLFCLLFFPQLVMYFFLKTFFFYSFSCGLDMHHLQNEANYLFSVPFIFYLHLRIFLMKK